MSTPHEKDRRLIEAAKALAPVLTIRTDSVEARFASCAVAALVAQARRERAAKAIP
jgi:hypothetical protein